MRFVEQFLAWLAALIAPQMQVDLESARAAACVTFAAASMERDVGPAPGPAPEPDDGKCCDECKGTGWVIQPDGHRTPCPCPDTCECKRRGKEECKMCGGVGAIVVSSEGAEEVRRCPCSP